MLSALSMVPTWMAFVWAGILFFCSPVLFVIAIALPEIPLLIVRRICYIPFDSA